MKGDEPEITMKEEWRIIPGFDYGIDLSTGEPRCKNLLTGYVLSNTPNKRDGRIQWNLYKDREQTTYQVGRWVALAYPELIENEYFEGAEIDHKDTDTLNNHPSNLRWTDRKQNLNNPLTIQHKKSSSKNRQRKGPFPVPVEQYDLEGNYIGWYKSIAQAQKETGTCRASISMCCNGKLNKAGGYMWKYKEKEAV